MKFSTKNVLTGTVKKAVKEAVHMEVTITLENGTDLISIIQNDIAEKLGIAKGKKIHALIKARDVILATE